MVFEAVYSEIRKMWVVGLFCCFCCCFCRFFSLRSFEAKMTCRIMQVFFFCILRYAIACTFWMGFGTFVLLVVVVAAVAAAAAAVVVGVA